MTNLVKEALANLAKKIKDLDKREYLNDEGKLKQYAFDRVGRATNALKAVLQTAYD